MEKKQNNISKKGKIIEFAFLLILITVGAAARLMPHPANLTPIVALALFGGIYLSGSVALVLPFLAMLVSDIFLGFYDLRLMAFVYGSFLLCVLLGFWLKRNKKWYLILGGSLLCSVIFFILTNFSFWALTPFYSKTVAGLIECYLAGLPFFKNALAGDLFYVIVFFGVYEIAGNWIKKRFPEPVEQESLV